MPVVLKEPTPPPLLRLGQWASALQPGAERPDGLADVPGASVRRDRVADQRKVADQLPVPRLLSRMEPVRPQLRNAQGVGVTGTRTGRRAPCHQHPASVQPRGRAGSRRATGRVLRVGAGWRPRALVTRPLAGTCGPRKDPHNRQLVVDLIQLTLNHGLFVVRAARSLAEAEAILTEWHPHMTMVDMDHDDSTALLGRLEHADPKCDADPRADPSQ